MKVVLFLAAIPFALLGLCILLIGGYAVCRGIGALFSLGWHLVTYKTSRDDVKGCLAAVLFIVILILMLIAAWSKEGLIK